MGICSHCSNTKPVMVTLRPGRDGAPWTLCSTCWLQGVSDRPPQTKKAGAR